MAGKRKWVRGLEPTVGSRGPAYSPDHAGSDVVPAWAAGDKVTVEWMPGVTGAIEDLACDLGLFLVRFGPEQTVEVCGDDMTRIEDEQ